MEWFLGRQAKTPERYMRIRNHILDCWKNVRPYYLTKTAGRKNLSNCGDVNAVGRVHAYLENIGAINVGCPQQPPRPVKRTYNEDG
jgi:protein MYSM1